jgi:hypothetical protein
VLKGNEKWDQMIFFYFFEKLPVKHCSNCQVWWHIPVIAAHKRLRQGNEEFKDTLHYIGT